MKKLLAAIVAGMFALSAAPAALAAKHEMKTEKATKGAGKKTDGKAKAGATKTDGKAKAGATKTDGKTKAGTKKKEK